MWREFWEAVKDIIKRMIPTKDANRDIFPAVSHKMSKSIDLWYSMYQDEAHWLHQPTNTEPYKITSLNIPAFISAEKARMAMLELKAEVVPKDPNKKADVARAEFLNKQIKKIVGVLKERGLEYACATGGVVVKPVPNSKRKTFAYNVVLPTAFYPLSFDDEDKILSLPFVHRIPYKEYIYTRIEYHERYFGDVSKGEEDGEYIKIINKAFRKEKKENLRQTHDEAKMTYGDEVSLNEIPAWAHLAPEVTIRLKGGTGGNLFSYLKISGANNQDPDSPLGVSCFSRAVKLIEEADRQYSRLLWEFEGGELAVDVDRNALVHGGESDIRGHAINPVMPIMQARLFRKVDIDDDKTYEVFSPALRDTSLLNGLNAILRRIEDACELSWGTISDLNIEARTATELKMAKQRSYTSICKIQESTQQTIDELIRIVDRYCNFYNMCPVGEYEISYKWDDSIITDMEAELAKKLALVNNGLMAKAEVRSWYMGESIETAQKKLKEIQEEQRQEAEARASFLTKDLNKDILETGMQEDVGQDEIPKIKKEEPFSKVEQVKKDN